MSEHPWEWGPGSIMMAHKMRQVPEKFNSEFRGISLTIRKNISLGNSVIGSFLLLAPTSNTWNVGIELPFFESDSQLEKAISWANMISTSVTHQSHSGRDWVEQWYFKVNWRNTTIGRGYIYVPNNNHVTFHPTQPKRPYTVNHTT